MISVLSMSRQGDPTARCLTTERTIRMSAHDEKENQIRGLSFLADFKEDEGDNGLG